MPTRPAHPTIVELTGTVITLPPPDDAWSMLLELVERITEPGPPFARVWAVVTEGGVDVTPPSLNPVDVRNPPSLAHEPPAGPPENPGPPTWKEDPKEALLEVLTLLLASIAHAG